jgi:shikimate 5-dehydrogenase
LRCVRAGPDFVDDPERYGNCGAELLELPLGLFPATNPGKLRLLADRADLRTLATVERLEGHGRALLEKAIQARFDQVGVPLDTDVETRGRVLAQARKLGVKVVLSHRSARPPRSVESVLRLFQKCSRAGGDLSLASFEVFRAEHVRFLREASRAASALGIPHGIAGTGSLSQLVSLLPGELVFGALDGNGDGIDLALLSRLGPSTRLFAILGEPAHPTAALEVLNGSFRALGQDSACLQLRVGPDGPGALVRLLRELGFQGFLVGRPFRATAGLLATASGRAPPVFSVATLRGGAFVGHDTDGPALLSALDRSGVRVHRRRAVVLGTGGAARSAARALRSRGARVVIAGRNLRRALEAAGAVGAEATSLSSLSTVLARSSLLVNAVPGAGTGLLSDSSLRPGLVVVDLDCSSGEPGLAGRAAESGAHTVGGKAVLGRNLSEAMRLFTGARPPRGLVERLMDESLRGAACSKKNSDATKVINLAKQYTW